MTAIINRIGLVTSIRSTANALREYLVGVLIRWLKDLPEACKPQWAGQVRELIAVELCTGIAGDDKNQPIDLLLEFDCKLWKEARIDLRALYVNSFFVSGDEWKKKLGMELINHSTSIHITVSFNGERVYFQ